MFSYLNMPHFLVRCGVSYFMEYYIYKITNPIGQVYIGCTKNVQDRWRRYKALNCKDQPTIHNSLLTYGVENHIFEVIEKCSLEEKNTKEATWGHFYNVFTNGLNDSLPKINGKTGFSERYMSKKVFTEETREKMRLNGFKRKQTEETKEKLRKIKKGFKHTEETKIKISKKRTGTKLSKEHKLKIGRKREKHHNARILLNTQTGIYYQCIKDAADSIPMNYSTFQNQMTGVHPNKTKFIYTD